MFSRRHLLAALAAAPWFAPAARADAPAVPGITPPTIDELLRPPVVLDAALSPNGERIAVLEERRVGEKRSAYVTLRGVESDKAVQVVIGDFRVEQVEWANEERLLVWMLFDKTADGSPAGLWVGGYFLAMPSRRVISINLDGKDPVALFTGHKAAATTAFVLGQIVDSLPDDPRHILMQAWEQKRNSHALYRVDVYTGEAVETERGTAATDFWITQNGLPVLRFDSNSRGTVGSIYARSPGETDWKLVRKIRRDQWKRLNDFDVVGVTTEPGVMLVSHLAEGDDFKTVRRFDLRTLEYGDTVARHPGRDLTDVFTDERHGMVGAIFVDDRVGYQFADPALARHFRGINTFLGDECNVRLYDVNAAHDRFILKVSGPRQPGAFFFYDAKAQKAENIGPQYPWLEQDRLARMETLKVTSRDGAALTAYLTVPPGGGGPRPMVVMPHGGPERRDAYEYDGMVQLLAAQGWLVLQPNFRGSGGYGRAFAEAGHRRWGDRMQEDVEDCLAHVLASGRADPQRLAIMGASYGGYAALMGAVLKPDLYKAVVAVSGDSDLIQSLAFTRREDGADSPAYAYWVKSMGDPKADEAMLKAASPRLRAAEIEAPVLLIHGVEDQIVTVAASRGMAKALKAAGKPHEYLELKGVGHSGWNTATNKTVMEKVVAFLTPALTGPGPSALRPDTPSSPARP